MFGSRFAGTWHGSIHVGWRIIDEAIASRLGGGRPTGKSERRRSHRERRCARLARRDDREYREYSDSASSVIIELMRAKGKKRHTRNPAQRRSVAPLSSHRAASSAIGHGAAKRKPFTKGARRLKSPSFVMSVMPCSRHDAAISVSLSNEGFSSRICHPSRSATDARARPLATKAAAEGAKTRRRRSNGSNTPCCTSRAASVVRAPAASSCITTALKYVNGSARLRKVKTSA